MPHTLTRHHKHHFHWPHLRKRAWVPLLLVLIVLVIFSLYIDVIATRFVNRVLATHIHGYTGSVSHVTMHLYRGAYQAHDLEIRKLNGNIPVPFIEVPLTDLSIQWGALIHGRIVSDVHATNPVINFAIGQTGAEQTGAEGNWNEVIDELMPIDINLVTITDGAVYYKDFSASPDVNINVHHLNGELRNLRNVVDENDPLPATIDVTGTSVGGGNLAVDGKLNILSEPLDMDVNVKLERADLTAFNSYTKDLAFLEFQKGRLSIYSKLKVDNGRISGYIKPLATEVKIIDLRKADNPLQAAWQLISAFVVEIFTNQQKDQFATQIPLSGNIKNPDTSTWPAIVAIIRNAFVQAFSNRVSDELRDMAE